jgi:hypothetical protein
LIPRFLLILSVGLASVIALTTRYVNEDLFGGLAAGRDIYSGLLRAPDHWSFTAPGLPWINQAWLSHLLFFLSYERFGPLGPLFIKVVLLGGCLATVLIRCRSLRASTGVSLVALLGGLLAVAPFVGLRQENFGLFFFMVFSTLLTTRAMPKLTRGTALLGVIALWCNFHGSFMLGLALVMAKAGLVGLRSLSAWLKRSDGFGWKDAAEWWLLSGACVLVAATVNPYGTANVLMPFRQLGTAAVTEHSADWLPLLRFQQIDEGLFAGGCTYPYLIFLSLTFLALAVVLANARRSGEGTRSILSSIKADWVMEVGIALVTVVLAFRFGRFVLFSALSLVPPAALILQSLVKNRKSNDKSAHHTERNEKTLAVAATFVLVSVSAVLCWRVAVTPYLPGNPCRPARPVTRELMSFDSFSRPLAEFMKNNQLVDRVLSGWALSPFLMWRVPEIRLFMDTRDQSYYPASVVRDYFTIMGILPASDADVILLLNRYGVETVALSTDPVDFALATKLMQSQKWACLYTDPYSLLLVRSDAPRFQSMLKTARLDALHFPDAAIRTLSEATLSHFLLGTIRPDLVNALKDEALRAPWPNYYTLICWGMDDPRKCFMQSTTGFLASEANRLSKINPLFPNGAEQITESLTRIYEILAENGMRCEDPVRASTFNGLMGMSSARYRQLRHYYLGAIF